MNLSIVGIGVVLSIIFAAMKAAAVPSMATWSWFGVFAYPIGIAFLIQIGLIVIIALIAAAAK